MHRPPQKSACVGARYLVHNRACAVLLPQKGAKVELSRLRALAVTHKTDCKTFKSAVEMPKDASDVGG